MDLQNRDKPPLASRRGRHGHRVRLAPIRPRRRPIVNRRPTEGGNGLVILRPGVMGLIVHRAPPFAPPRCCHPLATTRRFGRAMSVLSTDCREAAVGVRGRPGTASGGRCRSPLPGAPSGDPTPITPSVEEFLSRLRSQTFLLETRIGSLSMGGYGENGFLALKIPKLPPIGTKF